VRSTDGTRELLELTASLAAEFLETLDDRPVFPDVSVDELRAALGGSLPDGPTEPAQVVADLARAADDGLVAIPGGRYFGFVIGGAVPPRSRPTGSPRPGTRTPACTSAGRPRR
jgi:hypothetical protein